MPHLLLGSLLSGILLYMYVAGASTFQIKGTKNCMRTSHDEVDDETFGAVVLF